MKRQLAAVMFADIVGYSALMQRDEAAAAKLRLRHRDVFEAQHRIHKGEIIQYYGDGVLSVFKSAVEAANCAIDIQRLLQSKEIVPLRIGLHLGDIVFDHTEVYGDGVNIAARIESLGVSGAVLLSDKMNDELFNISSISTVSLGSFDLKNISRPLEVFAISNEGVVVPNSSEVKGTKNQKSIAVLPFVNMGGNIEDEYFSDGMTEEIINALAKIKSLKVTSRTSSFFFKNTKKPLTEIADELRVSIILEGSIRRAGDAVRITAQLIQAEDDYHFWSETWDRKLENIFETQDEISLLIADRLREHFGHFEIEDRLVDRQTTSTRAYELSLKARYHRNKWNPKDGQKAIALYEQALAVDAGHAESYVGLADCYSFLATTGFLPYNEGWAKSHTYLEKAIRINDQLSGVHYQLSNEAFFIGCDYPKSLDSVKRAIEINPNNAEAHQFISFLYIIAGSTELSRHHLNVALSINPLSEETQFFSGYYYYMIEDYERSAELLDKCLNANDKNIPAHAIKVMCLLQLEKYDEVLSYYDGIPKEVIIAEDRVGVLLLAHTLKNESEQAQVYLTLLKDQVEGPNGLVADAFMFMYYAVIGAVDEAFSWMDRALKSNTSMLFLRFRDPITKVLRSDPRYPTYREILFKSSVSAKVEVKKKPLLDQDKVSHYTEQLLDHIHAAEPYLDPDISLRSLSEDLDMHPNQLSWLLNEHIGKNFNDFINHYRIKTFKRLSKDPKNASTTIMGLAYDSGFNSKTTFNTTFKRETGLTPRQFLRQ